MACNTCHVSDTLLEKSHVSCYAKCGWGEEINSSEEKRKREKRERRRKEERKKRKETDGFFLQSTAFGQSEFVGTRSKVRLRGKGYTLRSMDSSYFGLFSILRDVWLCFFALRGCLAKFWNEGMLSSFDLAHWSNFGIGFRLGKRGKPDSIPSFQNLSKQPLRAKNTTTQPLGWKINHSRKNSYFLEYSPCRVDGLYSLVRRILIVQMQ